VIVAFGAVLTMIVLSIIGLAFLFVLGTAVYGILLAVVPGVASICSDTRDRILRRNGDEQRLGAVAKQQQTSSHPGADERVEILDASTEDLWRRMQGTSKKDRRRSIGS
jgi:hypothetical protein